MSSVITSAFLERRQVKSAGDEVLLDYRERLALEALERAAVKRQDCAEQCAPDNSPDMRIRAWEKVRQLRMPSAPLHPVLRLIAAATQLSLSDVRHEQQLRSASRRSADT